MIEYLTLDILPTETRLARKICLQKEEFLMENNILYHIYTPTTRNNAKLDPVLQTVIPTVLRKDILIATHYSIVAGHHGLARTYQMIRERFYWQNML
jgi:hypothetical protein